MPPKLDDPDTFTIDIEPVGRRVQVTSGKTLLDAAREAGIGIVSLCGGEGWCESCRVRIEAGTCQPPNETEHLVFTGEMLDQGFRLACQAVPTSDMKIFLPPESLSSPQRLQVEGEEAQILLEPPVTAVDLVLAPPSLTDLQADTQRVRKALAERGFPDIRIGFPLLDSLSDLLRAQGWQARLILHEDQLTAVLPPGSGFFGLAVDIGTTKLAAYLVDLTTGSTIAKSGAMNPQIAYGEDVVSRIDYSLRGAEQSRQLQTRLIDTLNEMLIELCHSANIMPNQVVQAMLVGNTAMHHLFMGLPVSQLALAPYVPAVSETISIQDDRLGLKIAPDGAVQMLPNIAGYVGADHVAVILATRLWQTDNPAMVIDVGTNTEMSLAVNGKIYSCSCASGPAFEGAHIQNGMRAAPGAIERVKIIDDKVYIYTIGDQPPAGICGSGILDVVAELLKAGILDEKGAIHPVHPGVTSVNNGYQFTLVPANKAGSDHEIAISRRDVNEIQLAKAAIRTGIEILLETAGIKAEDVKVFFIAGAFGTYLNLESAIRIGLLPKLPLERFKQIGNAAGMGAKQALLSVQRLHEAEQIAERVHYVELTTHPEFERQFLQAMFLR